MNNKVLEEKNLKDSCFRYGKKFPQNITTYAIKIIEGHETSTKFGNPTKTPCLFQLKAPSFQIRFYPW
jgi:hypothetical protein